MPGEILQLSAEKSTGGTSFKWTRLPCCDKPELRPSTDGRTCIVGSSPGRHQVMLVVSNAKGADVAYHTITISNDVTPGPVPPGPPVPIPPGPPQPPPVPSLTGFAKFTHDTALKVTTPTRKDDATKLSIRLKDIGTQIAAGAIPDAQTKVDTIMQAMKDETGYREGWREFADAMGAKLTRSAKALPRSEKSFLGVPKDAWFVEQCNAAAKGLESLPTVSSEGGEQ